MSRLPIVDFRTMGAFEWYGSETATSSTVTLMGERLPYLIILEEIYLDL